MTEVLAYKNALPPGLILPTAGEPTEQWRIQNFNVTGHPYDRVVRYGAFVVAQLAREYDPDERVSLMPTAKDINRLFSEGYGMTRSRLNVDYDGLTPLNCDLGFYPRGYQPSRTELLTTYKQLAHRTPAGGEYPSREWNIRDIIDWFSVRHLAPCRKIVYDTLGGSTDPLLYLFDRMEFSHRMDITYYDTYRFGARMLNQTGGQVPIKDMLGGYDEETNIRPRSAIETRFGSVNRFWLEFGKVYDTHGLTNQEILNIGTRHAIRTGDRDFSWRHVESLEQQHLLPGIKGAIDDRFGGLPVYRQGVFADLAKYDDLVKYMASQGVSADVVLVACDHFEPTDEFTAHLSSGINILAALSANSPVTDYILRLMRDGFDLLHAPTYDMQLEDFKAYLKKLGIVSYEDQSFVFGLVPRVDAEEALR